jgi:Sigma-70, region 4
MDLRPALRVVFVMHDIEGQPLQETAEALALSVAAVKTRSLRARLYLRERLNAYFRKVGSETRDTFGGPPLPNRDSISDAPLPTPIEKGVAYQIQTVRCTLGGAY